MVCRSNISMHVEDKLPIVLVDVLLRNLGKPKILEHEEKRPNSNPKHSFIIWVICCKRRAYVWDHLDLNSLHKAPSTFFKSKIWWWLFVVMFPPLDMFFIYHPMTYIVSLKIRSTMHCNFYWKWIPQCLFLFFLWIPWCKWLEFGSYLSLFIFVVSYIVFLFQIFFLSHCFIYLFGCEHYCCCFIMFQRVFDVVSLWVFLVLSHLVFITSIWLHLHFYYCYLLRFWRFLVVGSLHIKVLLIVVLGHKVLVLAWFLYYVIPNGA